MKKKIKVELEPESLFNSWFDVQPGDHIEIMINGKGRWFWKVQEGNHFSVYTW